MNPEIAVAPDDHALVRPAVLAGLFEFNGRHLGHQAVASLAVSARTPDGEIVGGAVGHLYVDCLFLDLLWVDEAHRGGGLGSRVLRAMEAEARRHGANVIILDTFDFQAAPFYEKQGYLEEARLVAMVGGHDRIYLTKRNL